VRTEVKSSKLAPMKRLLPLLLLLVSFAVPAETGAYRVEVIVFRNLLAASEMNEVLELRSFSGFPDLKDTRQIEKMPVGQSNKPAVGLSEVLRGDLPDDLSIVTQKSDEMDNAWRRLRSSQNYRPLVYTAWDQNRIDYYPPMRIHNEQVIDTQLRPPTPVMIADLTSEDPLAAYRNTFFQIDGSLQLRRSRFLHLFLDLEIREKNANNTVDAEIPGDGNTLIDMGSDTDGLGVYGVYTLSQNRQVSTGKMQYFDTPYFGALVYVSSITVN
jgi:hypothetical protein